MGFCIAISLFLRFRNTLQLFVKYNLVYQNFLRPQSLQLLRVAGKCNILIDFLKFILRTVSYFSFESQVESTREGRAAKPRGINFS